MVRFMMEALADAGDREALLDHVLGSTRRLKPSERLRAGRLPARGLALVARENNRLVGTVRLWNVAAGGIPALLLGPLAVDPAVQGEGIGANLMRFAIARAGMLGHNGIILVGDPEYYARFGFTGSLTAGMIMPTQVERRRFLALELAPKALAGATGHILATGMLAAEPRLAA